MRSASLKRYEVSNARMIAGFLKKNEEDIFRQISALELFEGNITRKKRAELNKLLKTS